MNCEKTECGTDGMDCCSDSKCCEQDMQESCCGSKDAESGCCGRKFLTKEEKIQKLTKYKEWLDNESKGVLEAIEDLKKAE